MLYRFVFSRTRMYFPKLTLYCSRMIEQFRDKNKVVNAVIFVLTSEGKKSFLDLNKRKFEILA